MKPSTRAVAYFLVVCPILSLSCTKEKLSEDSQRNHPPVANAGADITVNITSCSSARSAELDGSGSSDPDGSIDKMYYEWTKISGPSCDLSGNTSQKLLVTNLSAGQYAFELKVTDASGLLSKDTVVVNVTGSGTPLEIKLDAAINGTFTFSDNVVEWYDDGIYYYLFYDLTTAAGIFNLPQFGLVSISIYEKADSITNSNIHDTRISLSCNNCVPSQYLEGTCSINFKKLIQQGGGAFSGTWNIDGGSASSNSSISIL